MDDHPTLPFPHHGEAELWRPAPNGWGDLYAISGLGRVRSLDRITSDGRRLPSRILNPFLSPNGYETVDLSRDGIRERWPVHQLVARVFIGPRPEGQQVRHGPNGKLDNRASQLCYGTPAEDKQDQIRDGTMVRGERSPNSKLTEADVASIRYRYTARGETAPSLAREFGVSLNTMSRAITGKSWAAVNATPAAVTRRRAHGEASGRARLTDLIVAECRRRYMAGESQLALAREFGVSKTAMRYVVTGKTWKHVA